MSTFKRLRRGLGMGFLVCGVFLPLSMAQARITPNIFQLRVDGAYLGITMTDVTADNMSRYKLNNERGVIVRSVAKGSPAETAKLQEDDVILEFGGIPVWSSMHLSRLVQETPPGRKVELVISRDGKRVNLTAKLGDRSDRRAAERSDDAPWAPYDYGFREFRFRIPDFFERESSRRQDRPRLGITLQPLSDQLAEFFGVPGKKGVLITSVASGSPSEGKLRSGDVIISADGKSVETPEDLSRAVRDKTDGTMTLKVIRDKKEITVTVSIPADNTKGYKL